MHIAIIENNRSHLHEIGDLIANLSWTIDIFRDPKEFGKANLLKYDVIVVDNMLPGTSGRDLIASIAEKTPAQLFLMGDATNPFFIDDIENRNINGFINKAQPENIVDQLRYIDSKMRINKLAEFETIKLNSMV